MKIGLVRRGYSPTGGAENYLLRLADALEAAGHAPVLFAGPEWPRDRWPDHRARIPVPGGTPRAFADALAALRPATRCDRLFSLERVWQCDCYRAGDGVHRAWLARRTGAERWWQPLLRAFNPKHRQLLALEQSLFAHDGARRIIANSQLVRREIIEHYATPADRIAVVYNGLPAACFAPADPARRARARAQFDLRPDDYAVLFAGTGWTRKGLPHLLRAFARLPAALRPVLLVAGRGDLRACQIPAPTDRVRFFGPVRDMAPPYAAADVFVAPTLYDPFANACLEALAAGLPVLTTPANGFAEIIDPGVHGDVFDPADAPTGNALAALLIAWADPQRRSAARPLCAERARLFTIEKNVAGTLRLLLT